MQNLFNTILEHLRAQGRKSLSYDGFCAYRGIEGTKCAVGVVIPDKEYYRGYEGIPVWKLENLFPDWKIRKFLQDCQSYLHDSQDDNLRGLEIEAELIAKKWGLTYVRPA